MAGRATSWLSRTVDYHARPFSSIIACTASATSPDNAVSVAPSSSSNSSSNTRNAAPYTIAACVGALGLGLLFNGSRDSHAQCQADIQHSHYTSIHGTSSLFLSDTYRRRVFFKYERRIRMRSPPEKVFAYFASIKSPEGDLFMTSADLMRAVVPVFPPSESSLIRDGYLQGERPPGELRCQPSKFFMLFDTNGDDRISFPEYIFFVTLLSIPESSFSAAFKMFDLDGNGMIDREEFKKVMEVMRARTRQGVAQRGGFRTGLKTESNVENGGLVELFFGKDGKKLLRHDDFQLFLKELHEEIIRLEFSHYDYLQQGTISAKDFGLSLVAAADLSLIDLHLDRLDALGTNPSFLNSRISFEEFRNFAELRKKLSPLAFAMSTYGESKGALTKVDFQRAASQVCGIPITDKVVDIVFHIFDTNQDGNLSVEEFLRVLERRERDMIEPEDSGIIYYLKCWWKCALDCN